MLIAGEASGDLLAAELVTALCGQLPDAQFFGAGGTKMSAAGVDLAFDLTQHSVIGVTDVLKNILKFRRLFNQLLALAIERKPDVVIGVDYGGFNLRFGQAVKKCVRENPFSTWKPKIVQFVSPQVWASRPGRADKLARDYDLLLSIFPFEKDWYAKRAPSLRVEFVGHPMIGRFVSEGQVPNLYESGTRGTRPSGILLWALAETDVALASTGTVTMECAFFGVPTVTLYKTSWLTYQIAKRIVTVKSLTMPNLLAGETIYPEFIQNEATPENLSRAVLELLQDEARRAQIKAQLTKIIASLGEPGAAGRAAEAILSLFR